MSNLIISGSSHAITLRVGMQLLTEAHADIRPSRGARYSWEAGHDRVRIIPLGSGHFETTEFSTIVDGEARLTGEAANGLIRATGSDALDVATVWAFANIVNTRRIISKPMWRTCAPSALGRIGTRTPLTEAVIREILAAEQKHVRAFYAHLAQAEVPVVAVETPRIRRDGLRDADERRIALWIDQLNRTMWHEYLDALLVPHVAAPDDTTGPDGFLRPELRRVRVTASGAVDRHHATAEWAQAYLPHILDAMSAVGRKTADISRSDHMAVVKTEAGATGLLHG